MQYETFGEFMAEKRGDRGLTFRQLASAMDCTRTFVFDVEKDRRYPPDVFRLEKMAAALALTPCEKRIMYDLAGKSRNDIPPDLPVYIQSHPFVVEVLRNSRDYSATKEDWDKFDAYLREKRGDELMG